ncbi:conserved hypothetical protein [Talaromyces stipitatus ATCC 10500]|uniref:Zn(2)-C6 fungal-type domain-containing protein n=1 Tax=Talaromyces stipitatus (strain ATCC 10500 / CBS 375.48 / QM 6759 / NRRL 1006) TaxID=441959 RepID=B8M7K6_TALSN|nr:uncharacterized protein TSTA_028470 [Talaromyces stipitatus ATCC 10500]EED19559.1 conserved hypothetical protein [Talaromyces stipitatus ATCC 10500]
MAHTQTPKLRSACDACHEAKVKCTGGTPCVHSRIGKPKGSRNRKTLARMQEAAIHAAKSQTNCPTPPYAFEPVPLSILSNSITSTPEWLNSNHPIPTTQHTPYVPYTWISPQSTPTPPESVEIDLNGLQLHHDLLTYQQPASLTASFNPNMDSSQLPTTSTCTGNSSFLSPFQETNSSYPPIWQSHVGTCDCFHWQTSNLVSLHALKSTPGIVQSSTFNNSLQCMARTISACQRTLSCQSCVKNSSTMFFLAASLQMVSDHLEVHISNEQLVNSASLLSTTSSFSSFSSVSHPRISRDPQPEQQRAIWMMQIRHMLIKTHNTLRDIRELVVLNQQKSSIDSAISGVGEMAPGSSSDPDCLYQVLDKLEVGIGSLLGTIGPRQA